MVRLSDKFQFTRISPRARLRQGRDLDNTPNDGHLASATALFENVVQKVRDNFGVTVINSGYRGPALNTAVGGSSATHSTAKVKRWT